MTMLDPKDFDLPPIPSKRYFTIGETAKLCAVKPHVLRYWEQEFSQLAPVKRRGNRRYYQRHEIHLIRRIKTLLHSEGFTISGARAQLDRLAREHENAGAAAKPPEKLVAQLIAELDEGRNMLK